MKTNETERKMKKKNTETIKCLNKNSLPGGERRLVLQHFFFFVISYNAASCSFYTINFKCS